MSGVKRIKREIMSDTDEEDIGKFPKTDVAPMLTCIGCNGFYRGSVTYCQKKHGLCSTCLPSDKKKCPVTGCGKKAIITLDVLPGLVKELKYPVSCKFKKDGCDRENADEEVIADHENECGYRKVPCFSKDCPDQPAKDFEAHLFSAHHDNYGTFRDNPGKWFFQEFTGNKFVGAQKMWIDPRSGLRFRAVLNHDDDEKLWKCYTVVLAGKNVAKKFRAEMRLSSYEVNSSHIFNCDVCCLDDWSEYDASNEFHISDEQFRIYNKGHIELGDHNKKNGKLMVPVTVEAKMKKLPVTVEVRMKKLNAS